ncbi:LamG domain-containing protein [Bellilinea sp.]|uniref:LamG domain-containing protein n=1 Tax=Bellilinea sp. TaxID=2838785 RepID=UPI002ADE55ED|nr:LamG domain-containing protein [Bellilinea sp.]
MLSHKYYGYGLLVFSLLISLAAATSAGLARPASAQTPQTSLRFFGTGSGDVDRVKIPLDNPHRPVDVGGDFTLEFWINASPGSNTSAPCQESSSSDTWTNGNIILDRDIFGDGDYGDYGVSLYGGRIAFGTAVVSSRRTLCGSSDLRDGQWHHVAVTRRSSDGQMRIFVDGQLQKTANGPVGNLSYRDGRSTSYPNSDPFLVIAAEKHDYDPSTYPSFNGWVDEVRISNNIRYTGSFTPPTQPFTPDANTVALYHFDSAPGACNGQVSDSRDSSGQNNHGQCKYGGNPPNQGPQFVADSPFFSNIIYNYRVYLPLVRR